jgi:hypothetical protein
MSEATCGNGIASGAAAPDIASLIRATLLHRDPPIRHVMAQGVLPVPIGVQGVQIADRLSALYGLETFPASRAWLPRVFLHQYDDAIGRLEPRARPMAGHALAAIGPVEQRAGAVVVAAEHRDQRALQDERLILGQVLKHLLPRRLESALVAIAYEADHVTIRPIASLVVVDAVPLAHADIARAVVHTRPRVAIEIDVEATHHWPPFRAFFSAASSRFIRARK